MNEQQLQAAGHMYKLDQTLFAAHLNSKRITRLLNATLETEVPRRKALVRELFAEAGADAYVEPPFHCDYGYNVTVGEKFYCNYDCVFLDCGKITIGDHVMLGPKVQIYTAAHPIDPDVRRWGHDLGIPVTVGNDVWIGGGSILCPGCSVGDGTVIGAGSVVTGHIPAGVVAAGNPCRVIRAITDEEKAYWQNQLALYRQLCDDPQA